MLRGAGIHPGQIRCAEPHESHGLEFLPGTFLEGADAAGAAVAAHVGDYLEHVLVVLAGEQANSLFPWSPSTALRVPSFAGCSGFAGRAAVVGAMDFLCGLSRAGGIEFHRVGNGRPTTDFPGKGRKVVELVRAGCEVVLCHVNAPDEAAHMQDPGLKVRCLERIDADVVRPVVEYFCAHPDELGGVKVVPDHYTNSFSDLALLARSAVHSLDPVPFALWNGRDRDSVRRFSEDDAVQGRYAGSRTLSHLDLLDVLKNGGRRAPADAQASPGGDVCGIGDSIAVAEVSHSGRPSSGD